MKERGEGEGREGAVKESGVGVGNRGGREGRDCWLLGRHYTWKKSEQVGDTG